jgi:hypothetical protein
VMTSFGAEPGEPWQYHNWSQQIAWGRMKGLERIHYHLSKILTLNVKGLTQPSMAYMIQLLRAINQTSLDQGSWETAEHRLPERDPLARVEFAGTEGQLETIFQYKDSLRKLRRGQGNADKDTDDEEKPKNPKKQAKGDGKQKKGTGDGS